MFLLRNVTVRPLAVGHSLNGPVWFIYLPPAPYVFSQWHLKTWNGLALMSEFVSLFRPNILASSLQVFEVKIFTALLEILELKPLIRNS